MESSQSKSKMGVDCLEIAKLKIKTMKGGVNPKHPTTIPLSMIFNPAGVNLGDRLQTDCLRVLRKWVQSARAIDISKVVP